MVQKKYQWTRFWQPWDGRMATPATDFLPELESEWESHFFPDLRTLDRLGDTQCLVLLGEPGIGKTTAVRDEIQRLEASGLPVAYHDLKVYDNAARLEDKIFNSPEFAALQNGGHLTLVLDSIDEGRIVIKNIALVLRDELERRLTADPSIATRLKLRITCRSQEWPSSFGSELLALFPGEKAFAIWHLCQLRRSDVRQAASAFNLDGDSFLREVDEIGATALAVKPVTLDLLLEIKTHSGDLPSRQADLYHRGLLELCKDPNAWRNEAEQTGQLTARQRFAIARRIAALSILCQRPLIRRNDGPGFTDENTLTIDDICAEGSQESIDGKHYDFDRLAVVETLRCGLFRGSDDNRVAWAHLTYGEFLAADYLNTHKIEGEQLQNILQAPGEANDRIAPQLADVASWLSSINDAMADRFLANNPDVLLRSDVMVGDLNMKLRLADQYLRAVANNEIRDDPNEEYYGRLACDGLADVTRQYLKDAVRHRARYAALRIIESCRVRGCKDDLIGLALDSSQPGVIRRLAIDGLEVTAEIQDLRPLLPLIKADDDEILGYTLKLLWPSLLATSDMLAALRPLSDPDLIGIYRNFLEDELIERLPLKDLSVALNWAAAFVKSHKKTAPQTDDSARAVAPFAKIVGALYGRAIKEIRDPEVLPSLISMSASIALNRDWLYSSGIRDGDFHLTPEDVEDRRRFAMGLLRKTASSIHAWQFPYFEFRLINRDDLAWLIDQCRAEEDDAVRAHLATLASRVYDPNDPTQFELIYGALEELPDFAQFSEMICGFVDINSETAQRQKLYFYEERNRQSRSPQLRPPAPAAAVIRQFALDRLAEIDAGDVSAFWKLFQKLHYMDEYGFVMSFKCGMDSHSYWSDIGDDIQTRFCNAAPRYLTEADPVLDSWWSDENKSDYRAEAGLRGLSCLLERNPESLDRLSPETWAKWTPAVIRTHRNDDDTKGETTDLAKYCIKHAPAEFLESVRKRVKQLAGTKDRRVSFSRLLKGLWNEDLAALLLEALSIQSLALDSFHEALWLLFENSPDRANSLLEATIRGRVGRDRSAVVYWTALRFNRGRTWGELWPLISHDPSFCIQVLNSVMDSSFHSEMTHLSDDEFADLYLYLDLHLQVPERSGARYMRAGNSSFDLSNQHNRILQFLSQRKSKTALAALTRIMNTRADLSWVSHYVILCAENNRRADFRPPSPSSLLRFAADKDRRMVRSGTELLDVLNSSIRRFEAGLHGQQRTVGSLWNTKKGDFRPKSENEFSDVIVQFLRNDLKGRGIVTNREVELRSGLGGAQGERTDIHVDAVMDGDNDAITAIIEVKGCWNAEVNSGLSDQLAGRYLNMSGVRHGIFLVGRFLCPIWTTRDEKRRASQKLKWDVSGGQQLLGKLAQDQSVGGLEVRAMVLDTSWPVATKSRRSPAPLRKTKKPVRPAARTGSRATKGRKNTSSKKTPRATRRK